MPRKRIPGHIDKHGNRYRVRLSVAGERHNFTVATTDRRVAQAFAVQRAQQLQADAERRAAGMVTGIPMSELFAKFEQDELPVLSKGASEAYADSLKPIKQYFTEIGDPTVESVQARHIKDFLAWRRVHRLRGTKPVSNRTLQKDRAVLHRLFALADKHEYREGNPVARTDRPKADPRDPVILIDEQFNKLLAECGDRPMLKLYVLTLGEAGLRCESEALWLRWDDVRLDEGSIRVTSGQNGHRTKGGRSRFVPMTPCLLGAMREHFARFRLASSTPWVFHHEQTRRHHEAGARIKSLDSGFRGAAKRAKLPPELHQHDLRHRRVTTWLGEGKSPVAVMHAMGHSDLKTTMSYYRFVPDHLRTLVESPATPQRREAAIVG